MWRRRREGGPELKWCQIMRSMGADLEGSSNLLTIDDRFCYDISITIWNQTYLFK